MPAPIKVAGLFGSTAAKPTTGGGLFGGGGTPVTRQAGQQEDFSVVHRHLWHIYAKSTSLNSGGGGLFGGGAASGGGGLFVTKKNEKTPHNIYIYRNIYIISLYFVHI